MSKNDNPSYYAVIPANVRYDINLTANAKLLYAEITALCNMNGKCIASSEYFCNLYSVKKNSIQKWLSQLEKNGYIKRKISYKKGTKQIDTRYITILQYPSVKKDTTPSVKKDTDNTNISKDIYKNTNTTYSNNIKTTKKNFYDDFIIDLKSKVPHPSKVTSTKHGKELFKSITDIEKLKEDYINYQINKGEYAVRITAYMEDYAVTSKFTKKSAVDIAFDNLHKLENLI